MEIVEIKKYSQAVLTAVNRLLPQLDATARTLTANDLTTMLRSDASHLYMVRLAEEFIGGLTLVVFDIPTGRRARIEDVVVDASQRGRGIGRQLMAHALQSATALGARSIDLVSNPSRTAANALYLKMGFQPIETNVYRIFIASK